MAAGIDIITLTAHITDSDVEILTWVLVIVAPLVAASVVALTYFFDRRLHAEKKKKRNKRMSKEDIDVADMLEDYLRDK